ncbi:hypothetical protein Poly30_14290 [Planctomycetes bacterium Poly30]|uniref:Choice-of-anchor I domain-containing protein n=1 Tax=Saltatorellus ferox TaxID=2528018 RepID=A0A518EPC2_9BACT|nr:hypothetical protein Poly30_14290 [Planctomycetes bacterium Poly30]
MLDRHPRARSAFLTSSLRRGLTPGLRRGQALVLVGLLAACGGGGGGGDSVGAGLSAGANRTVLASEVLTFTATPATDSGITDFSWRQTAGAPVVLVGPENQTVQFTAPERATTVELEVAGLGPAGTLVARDRVVIQVQSARPVLQAELRSTIEIRGGGEGRAMASAVHSGSGRLFVIDGVGGDVLAYDVSSPGAPSFVGVLPTPASTLGFTPGYPVAVAAGEAGAVGITWTGETPEFPGVLQLVDPNTLQTLNQVSTTGSNPVDVEVTADGSLFAIACAGDPLEVGAGDGFGYITIVHIPAGGAAALDVHGDIDPVVLNPFDGDEVALAQSGIRFFASSPRASVELTPRAVAISPDGETVWASCPENDALVVIDVVSGLITDLVPLEDRSFGPSGASFEATALRQRPLSAPALFTTPAGQSIPFGGITALVEATVNSSGIARIRTVSAAGPVTAPQDRDGDGELDLTLVDASARQELRTVSLTALGPVGDLELSTREPILGPAGQAVTGSPSLRAAQPGLASHDEEVLNLDGNVVPTDAYGARFGGATRVPGSDVWLGEMRRNGLWRLSSTGAVMQRFVPAGTPGTLGSGTLPAVFAQRRLNLSLPPALRYGGFGAVAHSPERGSILAVTRLPLDNPDTAADTTSRNSRIARMIELDSTSGSVVGEYAVVLEAVGHAFEGMTQFAGSGADDAGLYLLESSTDPSGFRAIFDLDLSSATNLRTLSASDYGAVSAVLESSTPEELAELVVSIVPAAKTLRVDLREVGLGGGAGQPSALVDFAGIGLLVGFDDQFQLGGASVNGSTGSIAGLGGSVAQLGVVQLQPSSADFAGNATMLAQSSLPIQGLTQPLDLVGIEIQGVSHVLSADGGRARVLPGSGSQNPFDETARLGGLLLDTGVFTNASTLQNPTVAGDLRVSRVGSDLDDDGLVDTLLAFGGRSISLRSRGGDALWRSSRSLERRAFEVKPALVSSAATLYGIRPSSLALGSIGGVRVLAAGLEGAGTVMLYDLSNPGSPLLSGVGSSATRPVDLDIAPIAGTTLFVTDEARGVIEVRRLTRSL